MPTSLEHLHRVLVAPRAFEWPRCSCVTSISCREIRMNGFSDVIGSWKIIAIRLPRIRAHLVVRQRQQILAVEEDLAARRCGPAATGSAA